MVVHVAYGYGLFTGGLGAHYGAERLGCTVIPVSGGMTERQVTADPRLRARDHHGHAVVHAGDRSTRWSARASTRPRRRSKVGIFGAEPWTDAMRREIEERAGMHAVDIYGLSEVIGPGVAQECVETKDGLHVWEDHFYPEIVDPETGAVLPDGELGELVFTSLTKEAHAGRPLPHARPDPVAAADGAQHAADGEDHRPQRRHDDHPRREPVPDPVRGADPRRARAVAALPVRAHPTAAARRADRPRREPHSLRRRDAAAVAARVAERAKATTGASVAVRGPRAGLVERSAGKMQRIVDER